jgi:hypothetical protein
MPSLLANSLVRGERARMVRSFVVYELKQRACKVGTIVLYSKWFDRGGICKVNSVKCDIRHTQLSL